jgi:hypothetical protein
MEGFKGLLGLLLVYVIPWLAAIAAGIPVLIWLCRRCARAVTLGAAEGREAAETRRARGQL